MLPYISAAVPITLRGTFHLKNLTDLKKNLGACITVDSLDISIQPTVVVTESQFSFQISNCYSMLRGASGIVFDYFVGSKMKWWQDRIAPIAKEFVTSERILPLLKKALGEFKC